MAWKFELLIKPLGGVTEGPVWDGEALYFTHIPSSRILRCDHRSGAVMEWRTGTNRTNGLAYDLDGRLFGCCSGGRAIVRFDSDGRTTTIAERLDGKKLHTPNDLAIDYQGRIWFTNPWNAGNIDPDARQELDHQSVLRADPRPGGSYTVTRVTFDTTMPNGILVAPDQRTLYVAESGYASERSRELRAYPIQDDGSLAPYTVLHTFGSDARGVQRGIDGMCFDAEGNIIATAGWEQAGPGPMLYVFSPTGRVLETHPVPALRPTNCCFGGPELTTLYVTTTQGHLFRVHTDRVGWAAYP
jgi:gluconolactonase